jgi:hypothetical protein
MLVKLTPGRIPMPPAVDHIEDDSLGQPISFHDVVEVLVAALHVAVVAVVVVVVVTMKHLKRVELKLNFCLIYQPYQS